MAFPDPLTPASAFNACWTHLRNPARSPAEDREMLTLAHASKALWHKAGGPREAAIGDWQIARCYAALGQARLAEVYARAALTTANSTPLDPFMIATCHEAMARALGPNNPAAAARFAQQARALAMALTDAEDRDVVLADLADHHP